MAEKKSYIGRISNSGTQVVKAPVQQNIKKGKTVIKTGNDLRNGK